jgi:hypothetical protein
MGWPGPMTDRQYRTWLAWFAMQDAAARGEAEPGPHRGDDPESLKKALQKFKAKS